MILLLSKNEADCLNPQHRQGRMFAIHHSLSGELPRERFSPLAGCGLTASGCARASRGGMAEGALAAGRTRYP